MTKKKPKPYGEVLDEMDHEAKYPSTTTFHPHIPRVYLASKLHRAHMWREWKAELSPTTINIVSTWHDSTTLELDETDPKKCRKGWQQNRMEIMHKVDHLLVFGGHTDALNGTLVEIGIAIAMGLQVHLVGSYPWGTWLYMRSVHVHSSLHEALCAITGTDHHFPVKEHLLNDPT